jgi:hypothetical protein
MAGRRNATLKLVLALAGAITLMAPAMAQDTRNEGERACGGDASRLCRKVLKEDSMVILSCLKSNADRLHSRCRKYLQSQGQL